jgi:hypothetical protein
MTDLPTFEELFKRDAPVYYNKQYNNMRKLLSQNGIVEDVMTEIGKFIFFYR